jgi:hypothetical protein
MKHRRQQTSSFNRRRNETGMCADVYEPAARPKHTVNFAEHCRRIVKVRMRQDGDDRIEGVLFEGERRRIRPDEFRINAFRNRQLIRREINPHYPPPGCN